MTFTFRSSNAANHHGDTEMTQVVDIDAYIASLDSRNSVHTISSSETSGDESSISDDSVDYALHSQQPQRVLFDRDHHMNNIDDGVYREGSDDYDMMHSQPFQEDEAHERLVSDVGHMDFEENLSKPEQSSSKRKFLCIGFFALILLLWFIWTVIASTLSPVSESSDDNLPKHIDFPDLYNDSFIPKRPSVVWVENGPRDGMFTYRHTETNDIMLQSVDDGKPQVYVQAKDMHVGNGLLEFDSFQISSDAGFLMLFTNHTNQWRYSSKTNVYIYNLKDKTIVPLDNNSTINGNPRISYAAWSPKGHQVAYVMDNDLYVSDLKEQRRLTYDGSATVFNGVPDWVYEEEVFGQHPTLWWSPDATHIAYLKFNETEVPEMRLSFYTLENSTYPSDSTLRYPKAGAPNPVVSLHVHSLLSNASVSLTTNNTAAKNGLFEDKDRLIADVIWATEDHSHLIFKQINRVQDHQITSLVSISTKLNETTVKVIRDEKPADEGWLDIAQTMVYIRGNNEKGNNIIQYLDLMDDPKGYTHLAIIDVGRDSKPTWLTNGAWEVIAGSVVVDKQRQLVHYLSTERSPLERHLYTVSLRSDQAPSDTKACRTCPDDPEQHAYYDVSFSPSSGYFVLRYEGPEVPFTVIRKVDNATFESVLEDNAELKKLLSHYELPKKRFSTVKSGGVEMTACETIPPYFDITQKYPVLFFVYGGPGSQTATYQFDLSWHTFLASKLQYIIVTVDGRGTGFRGRGYRVAVRKRLGELETIDQINAARHWANLDYVDPSRIAIWGWSYGGYLTSKVIEANSGVFAAGLAVAPVTDWRLYDSVYTERYMLTPELNPQGYEMSAVNNMTGFQNSHYLLVHGTGDDNVHFQHSIMLVDKLTMASVYNYRVQFYPDNNHAIKYHNANANLYHLLTEYLWESFGGKEYMHIRLESHGRFSGPIAGDGHH
ncbi:dipeptidyl peptidase IV N-terminal region-domain-containing protein [Radiomyces spectabilis]|uniref:dipeptidyl peptidase IV N-terminal region-domain-containing protein n=1 Tax=Radiomyces spectabilis TaxID=64574 RepID=UPI00221E6085|nr:dipeptidyl peptidase IV N-terminal region-domain-containing protein [Radiomyces spectabilis]KAI8390805.1 dipeptidyl peptidase IV N-terminal region-domain-containing protein [Radiomyces spectabilis]